MSLTNVPILSKPRCVSLITQTYLSESIVNTVHLQLFYCRKVNHAFLNLLTSGISHVCLTNCYYGEFIIWEVLSSSVTDQILKGVKNLASPNIINVGMGPWVYFTSVLVIQAKHSLRRY